MQLVTTINGRDVVRTSMGAWFYVDSAVDPGTPGALEYDGVWYMDGTGVAVQNEE